MRIGDMPMPEDFRYRSVFLKGRPSHGAADSFSLRHPAMDLGKRAKIFSPFDALRGFSDAVSAQSVRYVCRPEVTEEEQLVLSRKLNLLYGKTRNSRLAAENAVTVTVTYFVPCEDRNHPAFGSRGQCRTITGLCRGVDAAVSRTIRVEETRIPLADILSLESELFPDEGEANAP